MLITRLLLSLLVSAPSFAVEVVLDAEVQSESRAALARRLGDLVVIPPQHAIQPVELPSVGRVVVETDDPQGIIRLEPMRGETGPPHTLKLRETSRAPLVSFLKHGVRVSNRDGTWRRSRITKLWLDCRHHVQSGGYSSPDYFALECDIQQLEGVGVAFKSDTHSLEGQSVRFSLSPNSEAWSYAVPVRSSKPGWPVYFIPVDDSLLGLFTLLSNDPNDPFYIFEPDLSLPEIPIYYGPMSVLSERQEGVVGNVTPLFVAEVPHAVRDKFSPIAKVARSGNGPYDVFENVRKKLVRDGMSPSLAQKCVRSVLGAFRQRSTPPLF